MNYFIYTSHHFTPHGRYELNYCSLFNKTFYMQSIEFCYLRNLSVHKKITFARFACLCLYFGDVFNKTIISLSLFRYECNLSNMRDSVDGVMVHKLAKKEWHQYPVCRKKLFRNLRPLSVHLYLQAGRCITHAFFQVWPGFETITHNSKCDPFSQVWLIFPKVT